MGLRAIHRIPALRDLLPRDDPVTGAHECAVPLQVAQRNHVTLVGLDEEVVPGERRPGTRPGLATLRQPVTGTGHHPVSAVPWLPPSEDCSLADRVRTVPGTGTSSAFGRGDGDVGNRTSTVSRERYEHRKNPSAPSSGSAAALPRVLGIPPESERRSAWPSP